MLKINIYVKWLLVDLFSFHIDLEIFKFQFSPTFKITSSTKSLRRFSDHALKIFKHGPIKINFYQTSTIWFSIWLIPKIHLISTASTGLKWVNQLMYQLPDIVFRFIFFFWSIAVFMPPLHTTATGLGCVHWWVLKKCTGIHDRSYFRKVIRQPETEISLSRNIWDRVFKNGLSKFCGRQSLKV